MSIYNIFQRATNWYISKKEFQAFRYKYLGSNNKEITTAFLDSLIACSGGTSYRYHGPDLVLVTDCAIITDKLISLKFYKLMSHEDPIVQNKIQSTESMPVTRYYSPVYNIELLLIPLNHWNTVLLAIKILAVLGIQHTDPAVVSRFCKLFKTITLEKS